ncbi:MAG: antibiotic biosynthesis monooxygenase [Ilumatobacteraceae bacterium]
MTTAVALVVKLVLVARRSRDEVAQFLAGAVELRQRRRGHARLVRACAPTTRRVLDRRRLPWRRAERQTHLNGPIAAALVENADRLLAQPPEINPAEVLASKVVTVP